MIKLVKTNKKQINNMYFPFYKSAYELYSDSLKDSEWKLIKLDNEIVGLCIFNTYYDKKIHLSLLEILPEYQNKHIGTFVMDLLKNKSSEIELISENAKSDKFYKKNGFICIDRTPPKAFLWCK